MSTTSAAPADPDRPRPLPALSRSRRGSALVPADTHASRALVAVVAVLSFLASLAAGGAEIVAGATREWRSDLASEATIQLRPAAGRNLDADVALASELARAFAGIVSAEPVSKSETDALLEPWLGRGLDLSDLPVPRLIVLKLAAGTRPDLAPLAKRLAAAVPGAVVDDHGAWLARLTRLGRWVVAVAFGLVLLVLAAAGSAVAFATRGAVADNREVVEVLRLVGAHDSYIARVFQSRFWRLGLEGGAIGAGGACLFGLGAGAFSSTLAEGTSPAMLDALFGAFGMSWRGYALVAFVPLVVALVAAAVSRLTVRRYLSVS